MFSKLTDLAVSIRNQGRLDLNKRTATRKKTWKKNNKKKKKKEKERKQANTKDILGMKRNKYGTVKLFDANVYC